MTAAPLSHPRSTAPTDRGSGNLGQRVVGETMRARPKTASGVGVTLDPARRTPQDEARQPRASAHWDD